jgi:hypothetical protein
MVSSYEWIQEPSFGYREWLIPAALVNSHGKISIVEEAEEDAETLKLSNHPLG